MKRTGNLFEQVKDLDNLRLAVFKALRGKRDRWDARRFVQNLDANLDSMRKQVGCGTISLGWNQQFVIHDPKERIITAPCFRERVLHHAIMNVCEPVIERRLIDDTFACRRGLGRLAALTRAAGFSKRYAYYLKLDIRKYFDSVSHDCLLEQLARCFKDSQLLDLFARVIRSFRGQVGNGLPIGSLTSQHFANLYLGAFDRHIKEYHHLKGYVRYMDDMILWSDSSMKLRDLAVEFVGFLQASLELQLKTPILNRTRHGVDFLGCRIYHNRSTLNRRSRNRYRCRLRQLEASFEDGELSELQLQQRVTALTAFTQTAGVLGWQFRRHVLQEEFG